MLKTTNDKLLLVKSKTENNSLFMIKVILSCVSVAVVVIVIVLAVFLLFMKYKMKCKSSQSSNIVLVEPSTVPTKTSKNLVLA